MISNPLHWWRRLPRKRRIRIIAFLLFALAAGLLIPVVAEFAIFVAPIIDIATLIDAFGVLFILSATGASFYRPFLLLADLVVCPFRRIMSRVGGNFAEMFSAHRHCYDGLIYRAFMVERRFFWRGVGAAYGCLLSLLVWGTVHSVCRHMHIRL